MFKIQEFLYMGVAFKSLVLILLTLLGSLFYGQIPCLSSFQWQFLEAGLSEQVRRAFLCRWGVVCPQGVQAWPREYLGLSPHSALLLCYVLLGPTSASVKRDYDAQHGCEPSVSYSMQTLRTVPCYTIFFVIAGEFQSF